MFAAASIIIAVNPLLYGWFIDGLQQDPENTLRYVWIYGAGYLGLRLAEWCFHGPARVWERKLAFTVSRNFIDEHYFKVLHLPIQWHQDNHSGATINRIRKGYESLKEFFQNGFVHFYAFWKFFLSLSAMIFFSPVFGLIAVALGCLTIWIIFKFDKPYVQSLKEVNKKDNIVMSALFDSLSNIGTVITLRLEKRMQSNLWGKVMRVFPAFVKNVKVNEWKWFVAQMLVGVIYVIIITGYVYQNWKPGETFLIGGLVTLLVYVNQFTSVFNDVAYQYTRIIQYNTNVQMATELADSYDAINADKDYSSLPAGWSKVEISNLNFYRTKGLSDHKNVAGLRNLNISFEKGQRIAVIGESGCGKSTLLSLMRGLYMPSDDSTVICNGELRLSFEALGNSVTLFPQDPEIFENTILYNITLGLPVEKELVVQACRIAQFADVIDRLPNGLDTHIMEKGVNLSGGQKQRLALARGIVSAVNSNIVLMDEPTSSVDPRTEISIYSNLFKTFSDKTIISSLHRLHLLADFDYIYVMENGRIADEGTFPELLSNSAIFKSMWQHQQVKDSGLIKAEC
jgi:ABC-type multidrug transport system fused ATPase/permease subunit